MNKTDLVNEIINKLNEDTQTRPKDFRCIDPATNKWRDEKTGIIYRADFMIFCGIKEPFELNFGLIQGYQLYRTIEKLKCFKVLIGEK